MGTTLSVMVLLKNKNLIAHVGDSKIYRLCNNVLEQLTEDHTFAQLFMQMGHLTVEEAAKHPIPAHTDPGPEKRYQGYFP
jgi:serine/threonine protein phosphatase PrpC